MRTDPAGIWAEYQKGVSYNESLGLYEQVRVNERFYVGKQWEGLYAPDLDKPVINVLKRVVSYFISMIVADDVSASFTPFEPDEQSDHACRVLSHETARIIEQTGLKDLSRDVIRNAAVDGDGCLYFYYDPQSAQVCAEVIDNTEVHCGMPGVQSVQKQPYVIVAARRHIDAVRREAEENGFDGGDILPDGVREGDQPDDDMVTVLVKLWKERGSVHAVRTTASGLVRGEWDTGYRLYPLAWMPWDKVRHSFHGQAALTAVIPNQIAINQLFAMGIRSVKMNAFPKILYDKSRIARWSNRVGEAIGVVGSPSEQVLAQSVRGGDMSGQVVQLIELLTQRTLEFMGASDASLGKLRPDNTSAIIATQKASAMPLELQRMEFYRFTEDCVRIMTDMMAVHYGVRPASAGDGKTELFDFGMLRRANLSTRVDIGSAAYYSELMQIETLDNLFQKGIITDAVTYLEGIPDQYVRGKSRILEKLRERQNALSDAAQTR